MADQNTLELVPAPQKSLWRSIVDRPWICALLLGLCYFVFARVGSLFVSATMPVSAFWPPSGLTLTVLLRSPMKRWPLYLAAIYLAEFFEATIHLQPPRIAFVWALADTLDPLIAAFCLRRWVGSHFSFLRLKHLGAFVVVAMLCPIPSALIAASSNASWLGLKFSETFSMWWFSASLAELVIAPFLLVWFGRFKEFTAHYSIKEGAIALTGMLVLLYVVFGTDLTLFRLQFMQPYLFFPVIVLTAARFMDFGATAGIFLLNTVSAYYTARGVGPFAYFSDVPLDRLLALQVYLSFAAVSALILAAALAERRASEESFRSTFYLSSIGMVVVSPRNGHYLRVNDAFAKLLGYTPDELVGKSFLEVTCPEERDKNREMFRKLVTGEISSFVLDKRYMRKDGEPVWTSISSSPIRGPSGDVDRVVTAIRDITARKRLEEQMHQQREDLEKRVRSRTDELLQTNKFLDSLVENIPDMVFVKEAKELRFVRFNKAGEELLGYQTEDLIGKNDYDFFTKSEADFFTSKDRAVLNEGKLLDIPVEPIHTRYRGVRALHTKKIPIHDELGNPQYLLGISEDITEKIRADEDRLRLVQEKAARAAAVEEERRFHFLADSGTILAESLDAQECLRKLSRQLVREFADWCFVVLSTDSIKMSVLAHADAIQDTRLQTLQGILPDPLAPVGIPEVIRTGRPVIYSDLTDEMLQPDSDTWPVAAIRNPEHLDLIRSIGLRSCIVVPLIARGKALGAMMCVSATDPRRYGERELATAQDLAYRAALALDDAYLYAESQRAVQAREDFMAVASHELKTPLTPLKMQLQLLKSFLKTGAITVNSRAADLLKIIDASDKQIVRLTRLVEDLLEVSRISAGRLTLNKERFDLTELVKEMLERFGGETAAANCEVIFRSQEPVFGDWDRLRMEQVIANLITNAMKYGAKNPIEVEVLQSEGNAMIRVKDRGIGIAKEDQARIFERFERAVSADRFGGLGMGLYITQQIVDAHGGIIFVQSQLGKGSTFIVKLPLENAAVRKAS